MEPCIHETLLPNHFQKDRLRLVNKSYLAKRKRPSKYSSKSQIKAEDSSNHSKINGSLTGVQPAFKLESNRRSVSESRLNVIDYSQSRFEDFKKCTTSDFRKSTVLIQTWERRSQYDCKKTKTLVHNHNNSIHPYRTFGTHYNKENIIVELKKSQTMLDRPQPIVNAISMSKLNGNYVGCNGTTRSQEIHNFKRASNRQNKPRPKSLNLVISDGSVSQEPEWISLSRKLCAKFVQSHLEHDVPNANVCEAEKVVAEPRPKAVVQTKPVYVKKIENCQKICSNSSGQLKLPEKPQWIDLSRKLCTKFIEEHIECEPCDPENQRISPCPNSTSELVKTDIRIIEKLGRKVDVQERKHDEQPEWITLSRKLRAKFIEGHRDDPDTISLDNQLNASDLEEYGADFKHLRNKQGSSPQLSSRSSSSAAVTNELKKFGGGQNLRSLNENSESLQIGSTKPAFCYWSDIPSNENECNKTSNYNVEHDQTPQLVSSKDSDYQRDDDVNYELTFETFETERAEVDCQNSAENIYDEPNLELQSYAFEQTTDERKNKKSKSLCDLTSMYDCDSLEYCNVSKNEHLNPADAITQRELNPTKIEDDFKNIKEDSFSRNRFKISYPERDKNIYEIMTTSEDNSSTHKGNASPYKENSTTSSNIYSQAISQQNDSKDHAIFQTIQSPNSPSEYINYAPQRKRISNSVHINGKVPELTTIQVSTNKSNNAINNSSHSTAKINSEYGILDSYSSQEEYGKGCEEKSLIHNNSPNYQSEGTYHSDKFNSHDMNFITDISVEKNHDENFMPTPFDDSLKCKIKISHHLENGIRDKEFEFKNPVLETEIRNPPLTSPGKQQVNETIKENHTPKILAQKSQCTLTEAIKENHKLNYWSSDPNERKHQISFNCVEYENVPKDLIHGSNYCGKGPESYYKEKGAVKSKGHDKFDKYASDDLSSYRPINPPLEFEMFELPSLCSPENQKILLSRSPAVENMINYGNNHHTSNKNFNSLQHIDGPRNESSDSETPNSTPFDARTLVSPSSYASDSEPSSWTLTKNNSYAVNQSPVPETDVSDCSLSVKCDYTPSCSNQSTMESKGSNSAGDNAHVLANGNLSKGIKTADNRFTEIFVDCETSKNWKKSHSLDHLEDNSSTACNSSFYVHLQDNSTLSSEELSECKEKTDGTEAMPESLRHLFNIPINNPIYTPAAKTSMLLSKTAEPPPCHYYSVASSGSSSIKETKSSKKSKKSDRSSSLKIKDIAQGIILTFRKFHSHSKSSHVSPSHYVDVSHLAENNINTGSTTNSQKDLRHSSQNKYTQEIPSTCSKVHTNRTFSGGYFGNRSTSESNLYLPTNASKLCTCDNLAPLTNHREADERSKSFNFGKLTDIKCTKQQKKSHDVKEKKHKNHHSAKSRNKKLESKATSSVSRKVQQMADGTLYLVTTVSGDTAVPGVYSDSPDTGSEISSHAPTKRPGESNC